MDVIEESVSRQDIADGIARLPLEKGCVLLVHSSLKSFGHVQGGAETVIHAMLDACGDQITIVMPTLTFKSVDERHPYFSVNETPSDSGAITEIFRRMPGTRRSVHLFSSAAACGADAESITEWHADTPCGPGTPYWKVIERKGYSLFIGTDFSSNTLFHCAEEHVHPEYLIFKTIRDARIVDCSGIETLRSYRRFDCSQNGIVRRLDRMEPIFRSRKVIFETHVGHSRLMLIRAEDNFSISCEVLRTEPDRILDGIHG